MTTQKNAMLEALIDEMGTTTDEGKFCPVTEEHLEMLLELQAMEDKSNRIHARAKWMPYAGKDWTVESVQAHILKKCFEIMEEIV